MDRMLVVGLSAILLSTAVFSQQSDIGAKHRDVNATGARESGVDFVWGKQFGSERDERTRNLVVDEFKNVYVVGKTTGKLGKESFGKYDGFIVKIDSAANTVWATQLGSKEDDDLMYAALDKSGNLYVTGYTGVGTNKTTIPDPDVLVAKVRNTGEIVWEKHYGTDSVDMGAGIAIAPAGDLFVTGWTSGTLGQSSSGKTDGILLHLDSEGNQLGVVQFGTAMDDQGYGITIGADSNIYVCGTTEGDMAAKNAGKSDVIWGSWSRDLKQLQLKQFGAEKYDCAMGIQTDSKNNVYIAGSTDWMMDPRLIINGDCFLRKMDNTGRLLWTREFGTSNWDGVNGLTLIPGAGAIISGCTDNPRCKSFCKMYDEDGTLLWSRSFVAQGGRGTCGKGVCANRQGVIYHAGYTGANLFSELRGGHDVFVIKLKVNVDATP